jgi:Novel STAND NTPase 1
MTLEALFLAREGERLTVYAYDALGGLEGAIAARAEAALDGLPEPARAELPALLRALTRIGGAEGEFATQPVKRDRFAETPECRALLDALVSERLLVADRDGRVRVAHEALLRRWARAQDILMAERDFLHVRDRLAPLAADWQAKTEAQDAKADDYLLPAGPLLSAFDALKAAGRDADLPDDICTFAARSSVTAKRAASRKVRNLRSITVAGLSALTLAAVVAGVVA